MSYQYDDYTEQHGDLRLEIFADESPSSPREWSNLTRIIGWDRRFNLSDENQPTPRWIGEDYTPLGWWESYINVDPDETDNRIPTIDGVKVLFSAPLHLVDYGSNGVQLRIRPWADDEWNGASGVVYVPEDAWDECMGADHVKPTDAEGWIELIRGEVKTYESYLNGHVYGYVVSKLTTCDLGYEHATEEDSCWGYYNVSDAVEEGRSYIGVTDKGATA